MTEIKDLKDRISCVLALMSLEGILFLGKEADVESDLIAPYLAVGLPCAFRGDTPFSKMREAATVILGERNKFNYIRRALGDPNSHVERCARYFFEKNGEPMWDEQWQIPVDSPFVFIRSSEPFVFSDDYAVPPKTPLPVFKWKFEEIIKRKSVILNDFLECLPEFLKMYPMCPQNRLYWFIINVAGGAVKDI